ncbi:MAG TPA: FHA domain-containing protein [Gemmataceae bacterium]|nr:FHA domain-containing protein [Gemmataceae bacterium]
MDDSRQHAEPGRDSYSIPEPDIELPPDFVPLRLVLRPGGVIVELTRPDLLLGRHSEADIRLPLPDISRRHCRFIFTEGTWYVRDLKSLNGTYVNEQSIEHTPIFHGDTLRIGSFTFSVDLSGTGRGDAVLRAGDGVLLSSSRALPPSADAPPSQRHAS